MKIICVREAMRSRWKKNLHDTLVIFSDITEFIESWEKQKVVCAYLAPYICNNNNTTYTFFTASE